MAKHTLNILRYSNRMIFKVCLAIFQHYNIMRIYIHLAIDLENKKDIIQEVIHSFPNRTPSHY